jgi:hypothetical protein
MKYETPKLTALAPAVNAIQNDSKLNPGAQEGVNHREIAAAYQDWE